MEKKKIIEKKKIMFPDPNIVVSTVEGYEIFIDSYEKVEPLKDYRIKGDPLNYYHGENYNTSEIIIIITGDEVEKHFYPHKGIVPIPSEELQRIKLPLINKTHFQCDCCPVMTVAEETKDSNRNSKKNIKPRNPKRINCGVKCPYNIHMCGPKGSRMVVETSRERFGLLVTRSCLSLNIDNPYGFLIRTGKISGLDIDHLNMIHYDDRLKNLMINFTGYHLVKHAKMMSVHTDIEKTKDNILNCIEKISQETDEKIKNQYEKKLNNLKWKYVIESEIFEFLRTKTLDVNVDRYIREYIGKINESLN